MSYAKLALASATVLALLPAAGFAQDTPGWYINGGTGVNFAEDSKVKTSAGSSTVTYDRGLSFDAGGGYIWNNGWRAEGELFYDRPNVRKIEGVTGSNGHLSNVDLFANGYYDFKTNSIFTPYIGAGVGLAIVSAQGVGPLANGSYVSENDNANFAYQGIAGVSMQLDKNWAFTVDYRYVGADDPKLKLTSGGSSRVSDNQHNILFGLRYSFGEPIPPVAETAAAPQPTVKPVGRVGVNQPKPSFVVFFDFNKADLTPESKRIIASAVQEYKKGGYATILVVGHTDTVGSDKYNNALSDRRANVVKAELERLGMTTATIRAKGEGKSDPLVETADGVREAHNRRTEIDLSK